MLSQEKIDKARMDRFGTTQSEEDRIIEKHCAELIDQLNEIRIVSDCSEPVSLVITHDFVGGGEDKMLKRILAILEDEISKHGFTVTGEVNRPMTDAKDDNGFSVFRSTWTVTVARKDRFGCVVC